MEKFSILGFLEKKSILVTGATGFLGKLFVEKVLRVQPNVNRLYLLLRAADAESAAKRLRTEVLNKDVFRVLREKHGDEFDSFISDKVIPVAGDVMAQDLGIQGPSQREALQEEIHVVVHLAATTRFDDRYDISLGTNTLGAKHVTEFSKKCPRLLMLMHVSTAYVAGVKGSMVFEKPFCMGETLNGLSALDIKEEVMLMNERLKELRAAKATEVDERAAMRKFGMERAKACGWPNTYVFTKAMGEMLVGRLKENLPVAIVRPAMVSSTCKEPFPGWIEGCKTIDSPLIAYAKGSMSILVGNPRTVMDIVPGDMVVNAVIAIMVHQLNQRYNFVYHVGSSSRNPVKLAMLARWCERYFIANPQTKANGRRIPTPRFRLYPKNRFNLSIKLPSNILFKALNVANIASCYSFGSKYTNLDRKYKQVMRMADLYEPFVFFKGIFDVQNSERAREAMLEGCIDGEIFDFDIGSLDWADYVLNTHIPGLLKYELK